MSDTVEKIKERLTIVDVIQPYVKLTRAGKYYRGLSPFNKEKTPSFFVSPDRGLYHCFSSGKGGDMFTFVEEMEGVDFRGALKILAEKAGVPIVAEKPGERGERDRVFGALQEAKNFYIAMLKSRADVVAYLTSRGLTVETISNWSIGYAPRGWQELRDYLAEKQFDDRLLERAGLVKKPDQETKDAPRYYDRFRGRVMFPIEDISGHTIGFSGRIFPAEGGSLPVRQAGAFGGEHFEQAKYLNSPETDVFDKSRVLYGMANAREGIRALGAAILVEGQVDLLMAHQAGYKNTVATSGTAFTDSHAALIKRYSSNILIAYDGDRAGVAAAGRAAAIALAHGMDVKIAKLPGGKDPADVIHENKELFKTCIKEALHVVDFYLAHIADAKYDSRTFKLEVSRTVLPYVAMIPNKIDQAHFVKRVAEVLHVGEDAVLAELKKVKKEDIEVSASPHRGAVPEDSLTEAFLSRADTIERLIFGLMLLFREQKLDKKADEAEKILKDSIGEERFQHLPDTQDEVRAALFEADFFLERHSEDTQKNALQELYADFAKEIRHEKYRETLSALRAAEDAGNDAETEKLMGQLHALATHLK